MDFLIEIILDLVLEGSIEISTHKKVPKGIRYPLIGLLILFFLSIIIGIFVLGLLILKNNIFGILFILLSNVLFIFSIFKFKNLYVKHK